jgi:hypothetical protein
MPDAEALAAETRDHLKTVISRRFSRSHMRGFRVPKAASVLYTDGIMTLKARWEYRGYLGKEHEILITPGKPNPAMARHVGGILARELLNFFPDLQTESTR